MTGFKELVNKAGHVLLYGMIMAGLVFLLKWLQWKYVISDNATDIYIGLIALMFTALGVWISSRLIKSRKIVVEKEVVVQAPGGQEINEAELNRLELSAREYEVLQLLVKGFRNAEIADELCISLSTVKTHVSGIYVKMDVTSRTQALEKANRLRIV